MPSSFTVRRRLIDRFDLRPDQADNASIDETLRSAVVFKGTNLWVLIFAIFIAAIGLNVNSAAVIIGAMLISPLMGPIMGLGYGAGINDTALFRKSLFNLGLTALISLLTSALYFLVTPLTEAHSELLARTTPTIWDVLIALFGGLAGMIGATRKVKSNLVPGVAIATALMPPLCTAGYGLATRQFDYFFGALYLFSINSVFIAYATLLMVKVMHLPMVHPIPGGSMARRRLLIATVMLLTVGPSVYLAMGMVRQEWFQADVQRFVAHEISSRPDQLVVAQTADAAARSLRVTLVGKRLSTEARRTIEERLPMYGLAGVKLTLTQSADEQPDVNTLKRDLLAEFVGSNRAEIVARDSQIAALQQQLRQVQSEAARQVAQPALLRELRAQFPDAESITVAQGSRIARPVARPAQTATAATPSAGAAGVARPTVQPASSPQEAEPGAALESILVVRLTLPSGLAVGEATRLRSALATRFSLADVELIVQTPPGRRTSRR